MGRACERSISIGTLNLLADAIDKVVCSLKEENGQPHYDAQAVSQLENISRYLRGTH